MARKWWTLLAVCVATFMLLVDITIVNVALPAIQRDLHAGLTSLQWVVDAYALTLAATLLTAGILADRIGRKRIFAAGVAVFSLASLVCGLASSPTMLDLARAVQGFGGAAMFATGLALIGQEFSGPERGRAIAIWGSTVGIAVAIGPLAGGALTEGLSWSWIFFINVPIGVGALALARLRMAPDVPVRARRVDAGGLVTFSCGLFLLVFGLLRGNAEGWGSALILGALVGAVMLLIAFLATEHRIAQPMLDLGLFRTPAFVGVSLATLAIGAGMFAMFLYLSLYMQDVLGFSPLANGLRLLPLTAFVFVVPLATQRLAQRAPPRVMLGAGLVLVTVGLLLMHGVKVSSAWTTLLAGLIVAGAGIGLANPAIGSTALAVVEPARSGMASGFNNTCRLGGVAIGIAALGAIFQHRIATDLAARLPDAPHGLAQAVASGGTHGLAHGRGPVATAARAAFVAGLNEILLVGAAIVLVGAVSALLLVRARDLQAARAPAPEGGAEPAFESAG
jgi:EmrB/QacA subfamily drug resistance transporter